MRYLLSVRNEKPTSPVLKGHLLQHGGRDLGTEDDLRRERKLTFVLHGVNTPYEGGIKTVLRVADIIEPQIDGSLVSMIWPSDSGFGPIGYPFEGNDADDAGSELANFIKLWVKEHTQLSFLTYSLGSRVVLETVDQLLKNNYQIKQVCTMAAAIDNSCLANPDKYLKATRKVERVAVLASRNDTVLRWLYPVGDLLQALFFPNDDEFGFALGFNGPVDYYSIGVPPQAHHEQIADDEGVGHFDYFTDGHANAKQSASLRFGVDVLNGVADPKWIKL